MSSPREFIKRGYAVVYVSRKGSSAPFARRFRELVSSEVDLHLMDKLVLGGEREDSTGEVYELSRGQRT